jgi:hypothetical protein
MTRIANEWRTRISFNPHSTGGLDWGQELWKWDVTLYEGAAGIAVALTAAWAANGRSFDNNNVLYYATRNILQDVIDAAGGVELAHQRLQESITTAQAKYDDMRAGRPVREPASHPVGLSLEEIEDAWYSLEEMIIWARILDDRMRRRGPNKMPDQGLIPALADGPRRDAVIAARSRYLSSVAGEVRYLADLNLHSQPLMAGTKGARIVNEKIRLNFPDPVTKKIHDRAQLTYSNGQGRNGIQFADDLMTAVAQLVESILTGFESNVPRRLQR